MNIMIYIRFTYNSVYDLYAAIKRKAYTDL